MMDGKTELISRQGEEARTVRAVEGLATAMRAMADNLRMMGERMTALEKAVRLMEKVTPAQAAGINAAVRERAAELCAAYGCGGQEKKAAAAIRKAIRDSHGVRSVRELPRVMADVTAKTAALWDDYEVMMKIKKGERKK